MITIGYSTKTEKPEFIEYIKNTCGIKEVEVIQKINPGIKSLTQVYNEILDESTNNIVVFCHDDILFEKLYWGKRIIEHFTKKQDYGILGVAGTSYMPSSGRWWDIQGEMIGQVYHQHQGRKWLSEYNKPFGSKIFDSIIVDGLFFAIQKNKIKKKFNEEINGFHFYDVSFCFENFLEGVKIGVVSNINITHLSIGITNQSWEDNRVKFQKMYNSSLPVKLDTVYPEYKINNTLPLVSVIMPIYNYGNQFEKSLRSVFDSTYKNFEIIIINDGSEDEYVLKKLSSIKNNHHVKIINQPNSGPSSARNNGITSSNGVFILPLDSDDTIHPDYIQNCVNILKNNENISPVYCDTLHIGEINGMESRPEWSMERLIKGPFIVNCSMFHKRAFLDCGGYDVSLKGWEDYDLWIRMGKKGYQGKRIPKPLFNYFHHEKDGTISTFANQNQQELYNKIINKNFINEII
jgi:glycosyltransferase involved in cell wall biosynthesis